MTESLKILIYLILTILLVIGIGDLLGMIHLTKMQDMVKFLTIAIVMLIVTYLKGKKS